LRPEAMALTVLTCRLVFLATAARFLSANNARMRLIFNIVGFPLSGELTFVASKTNVNSVAERRSAQ